MWIEAEKKMERRREVFVRVRDCCFSVPTAEEDEAGC